MLPSTSPSTISVHSRASSQEYSLLHSMARCQSTWLYAPSKLSRHSQAHSCTRSQVHPQSHMTICFHVYFGVLDPETCWVAGARHQEMGGGWRIAGSRWHIVAECMMSADIIVWILHLVQPPWQDFMMPHGHSFYNCSLQFRRKGRQFELGESWSPTQIFQQNLLLPSHQSGVYVCAFGLRLVEMVMMAMAMAITMVMVLVLVIVIIVSEVLRQVGWPRQCQHQSVARVLNPNNQYTIHWIKYNRLSMYSFFPRLILRLNLLI